MNIHKSEKDGLILVTAKGNRIVTMDELKTHAEYDPTKHTILEELHKVRDGQQKGPNGEPTVLQLHSNSLKLKHIYSEVERDIIDALQGYEAPQWNFERKERDGGKLGALWLADAHIGKLDIKGTSLLASVKKMSRSIKEALLKLEDNGAQEYLMAWLGDNLNTDFQGKTTKGTDQENNATDRDAYKAFVDLDVDITEFAGERLPTTVRHVPGNHDEEKTFFVDHFLKNYFKDHANVDVAGDADTAQYHKFGKNGFLMHHGDKLNDRDILGLGHRNIKNIDFLEAHSGHHHTDSVTDLKGAKAFKHPSMGGKNVWAKSVNVGQDYHRFNSVIYDAKDGREANFINKVK